MKIGRAVPVAGPAPPKTQPVKAKAKTGLAAEGYAQNQKEEAARMEASDAKIGIVGNIGTGKRFAYLLDAS